MGYSTDKVKLFDVIENLEEHKLVLPNFQREFVWSKSDQKSLLASFFVKLPIGSFLFLDGPKDEFPSKQIGRKKTLIDYEDIDYNNVDFLLDGQQRITTLTTIFKDVFLKAETIEEFNTVHKDTFNVLQKRWFINADSESFKDFFDFNNLRFNFNQYKITEPQDIEDMFEYLTINRSKDEDCWYNPLYRYNNSLEKNEYYDLLVDKASSRKLIPLFFVYEAYKRKKTGDDFNPGDTYLFRVLDKIASHHTGSLDSNKAYRWADDVFEYLFNVIESNLHVIKVPRDERGRAIQIFEKINSGGTALDTFDLIVAKAADKKGENFKIYKSKKESLRNAIYRKLGDEIKDNYYFDFKTQDMDRLPNTWLPANFYARTQTDLYAEFKNRYLSLLSLVSNIKNLEDYNKVQGDFIKKSKALDLDSIQINRNTPKVMKALEDSGLFLQYRCGLKTINDLSYKLMIVPVSYILMEKEKVDINMKEILNILEVWYWFSLFSGTYRDNMNKRCLIDIELLYKTIIEEKYDLFEEEFLNKYKDRFFNFKDYSDGDTLVHNNDVPSSIKNSLKQYMLSKCPKDFLNKKIRLNSWNNKINIEYHHIIPLGSDLNTIISRSNKKLRNNKDHILNSPINLAPILKESNNKISNNSIERYFTKLSSLAMEQHFIPETLLNQIKQEYDSENFYKIFLEERLQKIKVNLENEFISLLSNTDINY